MYLVTVDNDQWTAHVHGNSEVSEL